MRALLLLVVIAACEPYTLLGPEPPAVAVPSEPPPSRAPILELALGTEHSCALHADGRVSCWGHNRLSQLGVPGHDIRATPVAVPQLSDAIHISASSFGTCALRRSRELVCWGLHDALEDGGVLLEAPTKIPAPPLAEISGNCALSIGGEVSCFTGSALAPVGGVAGASALGAHGDAGCAVIAGGKVACWPGADPDAPTAARVATAVAGVTDAVQIAAGHQFACARLRDGRVSCWGHNDAAQLGRGTIDRRAIAALSLRRDSRPRDKVHPPQPVPGIADAVSVVASPTWACVLRRGGDVACWGVRGIDLASFERRVVIDRVPTAVAGIRGATAIASFAHTCVVRGGRDVACWGAAEAGQLGNGWSRMRTTPLAVPGVHDALGIAGNCALRPGGRITCWPFAELAIPGAASISRSGDFSSVALTTDGAAWSLWRGVARRLAAPPAIAADASCVVTRAHRVECAGGQLPEVADARAIASSGYHACVLHASGLVSCAFGDQRFATDRRRWIAGVTDAVQLAVSGSGHDCALRADRSVWCWRWALGPCVDGGTGCPPDGPSAAPSRVLGDAVSIASGVAHTCAARSDGTVWCWGDEPEYSNRYGQLGDGTLTPHAQPAPVPGIDDAVEVAAGIEHTCARHRSGGVSCWGRTTEGDVGTFATEWIATPQTVVWR